MVGIQSYGFYIPHYYIRGKTIADNWKKDFTHIKRNLRIDQKTVAGLDEDSLTMAFESSSIIFKSFPKTKKQIKYLFFGSESPIYAVNPSSTILAEWLGIKNEYLASDLEFACKAGTGALILASRLLKNNEKDKALIVASDKATAKIGDFLEYTAASASVSLLVAKEKVAVEILDSLSFSSDTPDFWRREGAKYPSHGGRFTGKPSYFYHIEEASHRLMRKNNLKPNDFQFAVFHMPNGKFPRLIAKKLGFKEKQLEKSLVVNRLGNSYTASALMGLVSVLETAKIGDKIFFCSYGSGAGSDALIFRVSPYLNEVRQSLTSLLKGREEVDYSTYLKFMEII